MRIAGKRIKRTRLIQTEKYVVAVDVVSVIPADDPSEPCYEAETVKFLREVKERTLANIPHPSSLLLNSPSCSYAAEL